MRPVPDDASVLRAAALLDLAEAGRRVVLAGEWARLAAALASLTRAHVIAINPPGPVPDDEGISVLRLHGALPLGAGAVHGIALDDATYEMVGGASVVHVLRAGGRLVLPSHRAAPADVRELARDDRHLVCAREGSGPTVSLGRGGKPGA
jgi:hypothetical protein